MDVVYPPRAFDQNILFHHFPKPYLETRRAELLTNFLHKVIHNKIDQNKPAFKFILVG